MRGLLQWICKNICDNKKVARATRNQAEVYPWLHCIILMLNCQGYGCGSRVLSVMCLKLGTTAIIQKRISKLTLFIRTLVVPTGLEPVTLGLWVPRSNQLSYGTTCIYYIIDLGFGIPRRREPWRENRCVMLFGLFVVLSAIGIK